MQSLLGKYFHGFHFTDIIGEGGMGVVFKARDLKLERNVAIKVIQPTKSFSSSSLKKFRKEAKNQARLIHTNIVTVLELIELNTSLGIVMEFIDGEELGTILQKNKRLDFQKTKDILSQVLLGLDFAHSNGIIHRDIKPSNIIIRKDGVVKIADFGIAKSVDDFETLTTGSHAVGTSYYMSPEQFRGEKISHLSDIYSLGCTAYEMATGFPPFYYQNKSQVMYAHLNDIPAAIENWRNDYPFNFNNLVIRMLEKDLRRRPKSCLAIYEELKNINQDSSLINHYIQSKAITNSKGNSFIYKLIKLILILLTLIISYLVIKNVKIHQDDKEKTNLPFKK